MKKFGVVVLLAMLTIPQLAHAQMWPRIQEALLEPQEPNPTVSQSNPLIEMGITIEPAAGTPVSDYQVQIMLTTSNPAFNPNAEVAASASYTPSTTYTEADIDTTALPAGNYWVIADLSEASGARIKATSRLKVHRSAQAVHRAGLTNRAQPAAPGYASAD